jgi:hypothetical protein
MALSYLVHYFTAVHTDSLIQRGERTVLFGRLKNGLHVLAILAAVASVIFFVCGIFAVRNSVERIPPATHTQAPSAKPSP